MQLPVNHSESFITAFESHLSPHLSFLAALCQRWIILCLHAVPRLCGRRLFGSAVTPTSCFPPWKPSDQLRTHTHGHAERKLMGRGEREVERHTQRGNPISWNSSNITILICWNYYITQTRDPYHRGLTCVWSLDFFFPSVRPSCFFLFCEDCCL